jgi:hypothetical protein
VTAWQQDATLADVPEWFGRLLNVVLPDFQHPRPLEVLAGYDSSRGVVWIGERGERGRAGFRILDRPEGETATQLLVSLAYWLQDQFFPESRAAWGEARPACPGHPHPAAVVEQDGSAWWVCPADGRRISKVGAT